MLSPMSTTKSKVAVCIRHLTFKLKRGLIDDNSTTIIVDVFCYIPNSHTEATESYSEEMANLEYGLISNILNFSGISFD